jgi:stage II sporulation protein D
LPAAAVLSISLPVQAAPAEVSVGLFRYAPPAVLLVKGSGSWGLAAGRQGFRPAPSSEVRLVAQGARVLALADGRRLAEGPLLFLRGAGPWTLRAEGGTPRRYEGTLVVRAERGRLMPVLTLPLEAYLESTVADEMLPDWPQAALEAQAIAARTYATAERGRHRREHFDFCDLTHCQLFRGLAAQDARVSTAVRATAGRVLRYQGRPATTTWHSTCGGYRAANTVVFGGPSRPYLAGGPDLKPDGKPWCSDSPHAGAWSVRYGRDALERALRPGGFLRAGERLQDIRVTDRLPGGYAGAVAVVGDHSRDLTGYQLWMALGPNFGWGEIKGPAFEVSRDGDGFRFKGHGLGHGVGICQWGARGRALAGQKAEMILQGYFPGTTFGR